MQAQVLSIDGKESKTIDLSDSVFAVDPSEGAIYYALQNELANARVGTAKTKGRSEVRGSHRKPWRQKGTGRARAGTYQSPIRVGGGVAFGPLPRSYRYSLPKKVKRLAVRSILSMKAKDDSLKVVEDFTVDSGKTRDMAGIMKAIVDQNRVVLIFRDGDDATKRAARNIPWLRCMAYNRLLAHDLYYAETVVVTESAAAALVDQLSDKKREVANAE